MSIEISLINGGIISSFSKLVYQEVMELESIDTGIPDTTVGILMVSWGHVLGLFRIAESGAIAIFSADPTVYTLTKDWGFRINVYSEGGNVIIQNKVSAGEVLYYGLLEMPDVSKGSVEKTEVQQRLGGIVTTFSKSGYAPSLAIDTEFDSGLVDGITGFLWVYFAGSLGLFTLEGVRVYSASANPSIFSVTADNPGTLNVYCIDDVHKMFQNKYSDGLSLEWGFMELRLYNDPPVYQQELKHLLSGQVVTFSRNGYIPIFSGDEEYNTMVEDGAIGIMFVFWEGYVGIFRQDSVSFELISAGEDVFSSVKDTASHINVYPYDGSIYIQNKHDPGEPLTWGMIELYQRF